MPTRRRRGRPGNPHAKRRCTTRAGRRTGHDPIDPGSELLLAKKKHVTGGRVDVEMTPAGVLFGRELIDAEQYGTLSMITSWLRRTAHAWGLRDAAVGGVWSAILSAATSAGLSSPVFIPPGSDAARAKLAKALSQLDGSRDLVVALAEGRSPPLVVRAVKRQLTQQDRCDLEMLRAGLDRLRGRY